MDETYIKIASNAIYALLAGWAIFSTIYIIKLRNSEDSNGINPYVYDSIPGVFTTLGVLGTFLGIFFGLMDFDVDKITESIPTLLKGLKTAFLTSIIGIALSIVFGKISQVVLRKVELTIEEIPTDELSALQEISTILKQNNSIMIEYNEQSKQIFSELRDHLFQIESQQETGNKLLEKVRYALNEDKDTSLLSEMQNIRTEQIEYSKGNKRNIDSIVQNMNTNSELIRKKFDEFSDLLAKNNTEALVNVMKNATELFNKQMSALIERLVQENFQELNNSVERMNKWQEENKEMISTLTDQFKAVSDDFAISSKSIAEITENTTKLTNENSSLSKLIVELQKVMIEDTKYQELITNLTDTITILNTTTEEFEGATNKLTQWISHERGFRDSIDILLTRLEEYENIISYSGEFWDGTKMQMEEGISIITEASNKLKTNIQEINEMFYRELNDTLNSLDNIFQQYIQNGGRR